ncbi:MAG: YceI family protein [Leptospiraceae bacterium]|nr:YceI family protein [Leptospiraceae bacterium]
MKQRNRNKVKTHVLMAVMLLTVTGIVQAQSDDSMSIVTAPRDMTEEAPIQEAPQSNHGWSINRMQSAVEFQVDAKMENVTGRFGQYALSGFEYTPGDYTSLRGKLIIDTSTVRTGKAARDEHMLQDDFFYVERYPQASVTVHGVQDEMGEYVALITLQIRDKTQEYAVPVRFMETDEGFAASGKFLVNRADFDLTGNILANSIVDDYVVLRFNLSLVREN